MYIDWSVYIVRFERAVYAIHALQKKNIRKGTVDSVGHVGNLHAAIGAVQEGRSVAELGLVFLERV
jgi:hypothetical protein